MITTTIHQARVVRSMLLTIPTRAHPKVAFTRLCRSATACCRAEPRAARQTNVRHDEHAVAQLTFDRPEHGDLGAVGGDLQVARRREEVCPSAPTRSKEQRCCISPHGGLQSSGVDAEIRADRGRLLRIGNWIPDLRPSETAAPIVAEPRRSALVAPDEVRRVLAALACPDRGLPIDDRTQRLTEPVSVTDTSAADPRQGARHRRRRREGRSRVVRMRAQACDRQPVTHNPYPRRHGLRWSRGLPQPSQNARIPRDPRCAGPRLAARLVSGLLLPQQRPADPAPRGHAQRGGRCAPQPHASTYRSAAHGADPAGP